MPSLSNNSGAQREPHCLSGKAKRGPPKVYQSGLRLLQGTGDFKGQIPVPMCIDIRIKLQELQQQDPAPSLAEMVQIATNTFYNREQERGAKAQEREKRKETGMPRCWPPSREAHGKPRVLKGQGRRQMPDLRQAGHWAKECPNRDKASRMACHKCHQLGHWGALCHRGPRASRSSAKPSLVMFQQD